jgi:hypothetical protein
MAFGLHVSLVTEAAKGRSDHQTDMQADSRADETQSRRRRRSEAQESRSPDECFAFA